MTLPTHIFDLPIELLHEVYRQLDLKSIFAIGVTCKYFMETMQKFEELHPAHMKRLRNPTHAGVHYTDDEEDIDYEYGMGLSSDESDDISFDVHSWGGDYEDDPGDFDDYMMHGDPL